MLAHAYPAWQLADGTFEIRELDIFETCEWTHPVTHVKCTFDRDWLSKAAHRHRQRETTGYLAPVHLGHHGVADGTAPVFAGLLCDLAVSDNVLRASITRIPAAVFEQIKNGEIPYRSVEIHDVNEPEISSLALLATTVPYFKFPITQVALQSHELESGDEPNAVDTGRVCFAEIAGRLHGAATFSHGPLSAVLTPGVSSDAAVAAVTERLERLEKLIAERLAASTPATGAAFTTSQAPREAEIRAGLSDLAGKGFVFAESVVRELAAEVVELPRLFGALQQLLPRAPLGAGWVDVARVADNALAATDDVSAVLHELGLSSEASRQTALAAAAEFDRLAARFSALGCSFSKREFVRARLSPVATEVS